MSARILIVDDEGSMREFLTIALTRMGHDAEAVESAEKALTACEKTSYDVVLTDIKMPDGMNGVELLEHLKEADPHLQVILMTAYASVETAVQAVQLGASDYIMKPFKVDEIKVRVEKAIEQRRLLSEHSWLRTASRGGAGSGSIVGESASIRELEQMIERIGPTSSTVLITGESGTGKELVARALHDHSACAEGPFVTVNCGAIPEGLLESELFGHKKGAFTGAVQDKDGLFKVANGGTLLLDEIGETPLQIQVKLLRVLQEREIVPVGDTRPLPVEVRLIAATNTSLEERVKTGTFREDLFYRLNVVPIHIPPLRERDEDIALLARHFVALFGRGEYEFSEAALGALKNYTWPGNVRELENAVENAVIMADTTTIGPADLPVKITEAPEDKMGALPEAALTPTLEQIEKAYIAWVLEQAGGVKTAAAEILGIDPSTLHRKMDRYGMRGEGGE